MRGSDRIEFCGAFCTWAIAAQAASGRNFYANRLPQLAPRTARNCSNEREPEKTENRALFRKIALFSVRFRVVFCIFGCRKDGGFSGQRAWNLRKESRDSNALFSIC